MSEWYTDDSSDATADQVLVLKLFVVGNSPISVRAITNLNKILESHSQGNYTLEIIDAHQQPSLVAKENVTATPTLIKTSPSPMRRLVGDMSNLDKVVKGLGLEVSK